MIELQHLKKQYETATPLMDVNTTINKGDVIAVIGPSGTGKSTLLRCINLLERPTSGRILLDGEDITSLDCDINRVRLKMGMVFQSFNLYEHLTAVENCMLAQTVLLKRSRQQAYERAMDLLTSVGMDQRALQYPSQLSGGQKQRVAIARTLSTEPEIILFDEPTSALDPLTVGEVELVIKRLSEEGNTMMIVTHSMDFAKSVSNRVFYMDQGGIYEDGTPEQIFNNPQKELTYKFIHHLPSLDMMVTEENHDLNKEIGKIYSFCKEEGIDAKRTMCVCAVYEELQSALYRYVFGDDKTSHYVLRTEPGTDKLRLTAVPYSIRLDSEIRKNLSESLEVKLIDNYISDYYEEDAKEGIGSKYVYVI